MVSGNRQTDEGSFRQSFTISRQVADLLRFSRCGSCRLFLAWPVSPLVLTGHAKNNRHEPQRLNRSKSATCLEIVNDCLKEPSSVWRLPDTITTRSRHTVTDQGGAPRPSSSLQSCSPSAVTGQTLSTRGAATDATHGRAVAHGCVHRSTSLGCLRLCRTRKSLNLSLLL